MIKVWNSLNFVPALKRHQSKFGILFSVFFTTSPRRNKYNQRGVWLPKAIKWNLVLGDYPGIYSKIYKRTFK